MRKQLKSLFVWSDPLLTFHTQAQRHIHTHTHTDTHVYIYRK